MGEIPLQKGPQGYLSLGDSYIRHTDTITEDCPSTTSYREFEKIVDDIIMHSDTMEGAFQRIRSILSQCNKNGLVFNSEKFRFARREADAISRCKHLHMFYVSVGQTMVADKDYDFSQLLEVVHVVINLVNSHDVLEHHLQSQAGGRDHAEANGPHPARDARLWA